MKDDLCMKYNLPFIGYGPGSIGEFLSCKTNKDDLFSKAIKHCTYQYYDIPRYKKTVVQAIEMGYRLIDYSASYGDGKLIGDAIKTAGVDRKDIYVTTRVSNMAQLRGEEESEFKNQLKNMGLDYVDVLMFHWPVTSCYEETWKFMIRMKEEGYCRYIGVANCNIHHIEKLKDTSGIYPEINQFEIHPLFTQKDLVHFCQKNDIQVEAYTPTARQDKRLISSRVLNSIAKSKNKSVNQILLRWHIQNGIIPIIRSMNVNHLKSDLDIFDFELTTDEMMRIDSLNINSRLRYDPDNCDFEVL